MTLNRPFTELTTPTTTKVLVYRLKKSNETRFTALEVALLARHWENTLASRVLTRNIFAVDASLFVEKDYEHMHMFVRARDTYEEALKFLYREIFDDGRLALDVSISDYMTVPDEFLNKRRDMCREASDQYHLYQERTRFVRMFSE